MQSCVETAVSSVAAETTIVHCAGRTDTGVHATGQVIHFDTNAVRSQRSWLLGVNSNLPGDVAVTWVRPVATDFHARYSALRRTYRYLLIEQSVRSALWRHHALVLRDKLDHERMAQAGRLLLGEHDFTAFRAAGCQSKTSLRDLQRLDVARHGKLIEITVTANAFLQHMVRNLVGVLLAIGRGDRPPEWAGEVLRGRDRTRGGVTAVPQGLYLAAVEYPSLYDLPKLTAFPGLLTPCERE